MGIESERLCKEIADQSEGICLLSFSRGKDSIASWLTLKKYFTKIIPFHCASVPHLSFVDESLDYFENVFKSKIERCISGEVISGISNLWYQSVEDEDLIDFLDMPEYDNHDIANAIRAKNNCQNAWCAYGINMSDSIDRRIYVSKYKGKIDAHKSFYPCYDFSKEDVMNLVSNANIKLPGDYKIASRTIAAMIGFRGLEKMMEVFPNDFDKVETCFPFIKAILARNTFRKRSELNGTAI